MIDSLIRFVESSPGAPFAPVFPDHATESATEDSAPALPGLERPFRPRKKTLFVAQANQVAFQVGTFQGVKRIRKARKPSYQMELDLGRLGRKTTCGQFVKHYGQVDQIEGVQGIGVTNLPRIRIAGVSSEALTVGFPEHKGESQAIYLTPGTPVENGEFVMCTPSAPSPASQIVYDDFQALEVKVATIQAIHAIEESCVALLDLGEEQAWALIPGRVCVDSQERWVGCQVPALLNLAPFYLESFRMELAGVLFVVPSQEESVLVVVSKPVTNGLDLF